MRNIFLEKSYTKYGGETGPRLFSEKIEIAHISGSVVESFIQFVFIICQVEGYQNISKLSCRSLAFTSFKAFLKKKNRSGTSLLALFSA